MASQGLQGLSDCRSAPSYPSYLNSPVGFTTLQHPAQYQQPSQNAQPCYDSQLQAHIEAQLHARHFQESQEHQNQQRAFSELLNLPMAGLYQESSDFGVPAAFELKLQAHSAAAQRFDLEAYGLPTQPPSPLNTKKFPAAMHGLDGYAHSICQFFFSVLSLTCSS